MALVQGKIPPADVPTLSQQILREYPTRNAMMNRELVKLLVYLQPPGAAHALAHQLESDIPDIEKLQIAAYAPRIATGWELAGQIDHAPLSGTGSGQLTAAIACPVTSSILPATSSPTSRSTSGKQLIAEGEKFPTSALSVLAKLPENPGPDVLKEVRALGQTY